MSDNAGTDRTPLPRLLAKPPQPPQVTGFSPPTEPTPEPEPPAEETKPKTKPKTKAKAKAKAKPKKHLAAAGETDAAASAPRTEPGQQKVVIKRTSTRLPHSLIERVRSAARAQKVARARLLLIAYLEHEDDLAQLLHPTPVKPRHQKYASIGLEPDDTGPKSRVTWDLPAPAMARLDASAQQHGVTRTALIRAVLEAAYPEQEQP